MYPVIFSIHIEHFHNIQPVSSSKNIYWMVIIGQALLDEKVPGVNNVLGLWELTKYITPYISIPQYDEAVMLIL